MDHEDDDFGFDDDGLDALPADTLLELETEALRATQQQPQYYHGNDSDYGIDDDDDAQPDQVINPLNDIAGSAPAPWAASRHTPANASNQEPSYGYSAMDVDNAPPRSQADPGQLLQRIKRLEQEKARLSRELHNEKTQNLVRSGETDTARRRLETERRETERKIAALQHQHNEDLAKARAELEKLRREREQAQTDAMFLEHDLAREAEKAKRAKRAMTVRNRPETAASPAATPRKQQKALPLRDGFDDEDMIVVSPSKTRDRAKPSTPKGSSKRKRLVADQSPVPALQLSEPRPSLQAQESAASAETFDPELLKRLRKDDRRFQLLHRLINSHCSKDDERLMEALTQYAFPSQPEKKLSSRVYDELTALSVEENAQELAIKLCHIFLSLWSQCLREHYYAPIYLCLDALHFILASSRLSVAVSLTERAVPVILASVDLVAFPIARACMSHITPADLYSPVQRKIDSDIDVIDCLDLLHTIATACITDLGAATRFWTCIPIDFPLHLLRKAQPLECIAQMLSILSTSLLPDSLGPRVLTQFGPEQQEKRETDLIDRLTKLLSDVPEPIPEPSTTTGSSPSAPIGHYSTKEILQLRLQILNLLTTFSRSAYGSRRLSTMRYTVGRLLGFLHSQIASLYSPTPLHPARPLVIGTINTTMKLIHHLKMEDPSLDIKSKLNVIPGGGHKYLVALTRLAFSERLVLEKGIEKEVVDAAYSVLDAGLTPEEGEGLLMVFSSAGSV